MKCSDCAYFDKIKVTKSKVFYNALLNSMDSLEYKKETVVCCKNSGSPIDISERRKVCSEFKEEETNSKSKIENLPKPRPVGEIFVEGSLPEALPGREGY